MAFVRNPMTHLEVQWPFRDEVTYPKCRTVGCIAQCLWTPNMNIANGSLFRNDRYSCMSVDIHGYPLQIEQSTKTLCCLVEPFGW
jgi:hypothetical protein